MAFFIWMKYNSAFLTLATANLHQLVLFYRLFFEQNPVTHVPQRYAEFVLPQLRLGLFCPKAQHQAEFASASGAPLSLCLEVESLDAAIAQFTTTYQILVDQGLWTGPPPLGELLTPSHGREIYAYDPDGNRLILHEAILTENDPC